MSVHFSLLAHIVETSSELGLHQLFVFIVVADSLTVFACIVQHLGTGQQIRCSSLQVGLRKHVDSAVHLGKGSLFVFLLQLTLGSSIEHVGGAHFTICQFLIQLERLVVFLLRIEDFRLLLFVDGHRIAAIGLLGLLQGEIEGPGCIIVSLQQQLLGDELGILVVGIVLAVSHLDGTLHVVVSLCILSFG